MKRQASIGLSLDRYIFSKGLEFEGSRSLVPANKKLTFTTNMAKFYKLSLQFNKIKIKFILKHAIRYPKNSQKWEYVL